MEWLPELHRRNPADENHATAAAAAAAAEEEEENDAESKVESHSNLNVNGNHQLDPECVNPQDSGDDWKQFPRYNGLDLSAMYWGPTRDITEQALVALVKPHLPSQKEALDAGPWSLISRQHGVYNSVYILQSQRGDKLCVRVPACGWSERWNRRDAELLRVTALAMRMLEVKTTVPLPRVMAYDCSLENQIAAPFMLMSCIPGVCARQMWNADEGVVPKEMRRQNILRGIAQAMAGLRELRYSSSGSPWFDEGSEGEPYIGESWNLRIEGYVIKRQFETAESYCSTRKKVMGNVQTLLKDDCSPSNQRDLCTRGVLELYRLISDAFLTATDVPEAGEEFVLMHTDFDIQNMMVDEQGHLTGIFDWDGLSSQPRQVGWSMVPFWLQGDWSPGYQWLPAIGASYAMVSPDEFHNYRQDYARYLWEACGGVGDCRFTTKSHIYRAFLGSTSDMFAVRRFVENVLADILPRVNALVYCSQLGRYGFRSGEKEWLEKRLYDFFIPEPPRGVIKGRGLSRSFQARWLSVQFLLGALFGSLSEMLGMILKICDNVHS